MNLNKLLQDRINKRSESTTYFEKYGFTPSIEDLSESIWLLNFLLIFPFFLLIFIHSSRIAVDAPAQQYSGYFVGSCKTTKSSGGRGSPSKTTTLSIIGSGVDYKFNLDQQPFLCNTKITHFSTVSDSAIYFNQQTYILDATYRNNYSYKTQTVTRSIEEINKNEIDSFNLFMTGCYLFLFLLFAFGMYFLPPEKLKDD